MSHLSTFPMPSSPAVLQATAPAQPALDLLARAHGFARALIETEELDTGENVWAHAQAQAAILAAIGGSEEMQAAVYLVYACPHLNKPEEVLSKAFGENLAQLALQTNQLVHLQRLSRAAAGDGLRAEDIKLQTENVRKMLLAFSRDLRVVMLRLASRLQTLRHFAATKLPVPAALARESLQVFAPLANRLGIWQIKWEMEDLSFRLTMGVKVYHLGAHRAHEEILRRIGLNLINGCKTDRFYFCEFSYGNFEEQMLSCRKIIDETGNSTRATYKLVSGKRKEAIDACKNAFHAAYAIEIRNYTNEAWEQRENYYTANAL